MENLMSWQVLVYEVHANTVVHHDEQQFKKNKQKNRKRMDAMKLTSATNC